MGEGPEIHEHYFISLTRCFNSRRHVTTTWILSWEVSLLPYWFEKDPGACRDLDQDSAWKLPKPLLSELALCLVGSDGLPEAFPHSAKS